MSTHNDFQQTQPAAELEELIKEVPGLAPARRSVLDEYAEMIAAGLARTPPLSYEQLAKVLNAKFERDGRTGADGNPLTVTRQAVNQFVLRRKAQHEKRLAEAEALHAGAPAPAAGAVAAPRVTRRAAASSSSTAPGAPVASSAPRPQAPRPQANTPGAFNSPKKVSLDEFKRDESAPEQNPLLTKS